ncbi:MAG TPA: carboxypeptidase regulatory-like domain-containing protein [Terriglobales bacterium]|nr:carboxypeptidase regulatory-like domain-containing protein [Terriglobales bacterium]
MKKVWVVLVSILGLALCAAAQQGSISGTVKDPSGAVIAGASVSAVNVNTGAKFDTTSNDAGIYTLPVLPVGSYEITVSHSGFGTLVQKEVQVTVGSSRDLGFALTVASQQEKVEVTGEVPVVETTRTSVASTVDSRAVSELPTNGRNFMDFVQLTPGVTRDVRTGDISFAGLRGTLNSLQIDGADNNNTFFGQTAGRTGSGRAPYQFSEDAVQEFQVNSNSYSAEYGHAGGAVVNVVTKSGTNNFHGSAFEFYRDRAMNANDFINKIFGRAKGAYHWHQFGGTIGGPIKKDKLFFFFDYDGQRNTQQNLVTLNLPKGFALSANPATAALQTAAINYLTPLANSWNKTYNQNVYMTKIDWNITQRNLLSGRWNRQTFTGLGQESSGNVASEHTGYSNVYTDTITGSLTSTLTNNMVNVARLDYLRDNEPGASNSINPEALVREAGVTVLTIGRNNFSPRYTNIHRVQAGDTVAITHGRHSLKFGADFIDDHIANFFPGFFSGSYTYVSLADFGAALGGTLQPAMANCGLPAGTVVCKGDKFGQSFAGTNTSGPLTRPNLFDFGSFLQDEWRVNSKLTVNGGIRYDLELKAQPTVDNGALTTALASGATAGTLPPTLAAEATQLRTNRAHNDHLDFAPRVGVAYDPTGDHKLVLRAGYGMFYGRMPAITYATAMSTQGIQVQRFNFDQGSASAGLFPSTYPNTVCGAPPSDGTPPSCAPPTTGGTTPTIFVVAPEFHDPLVQQGSAGVEYEVANDLSIGLSYLWVKGNRLTRTRDLNLSAPTAATIPIAGGGTLSYLAFPTTSTGAPIRPLTGFDRIDQFESTAASIYNGMTLSVNKRFSHHFQGTAAYTWGHAIDNGPDATAVVPGNSGDDSKIVSNQYDYNVDRGNAINDQRHRLVLSSVWNVGDYANGMSAAPRAILGGWETSFIFSAESGQPFSAMAGFDLNGDGNQFNDRIPTSGRNQFYTPARINLNPRITRNVRLGERVQMKLIWEAFNVFNRANYVTANNSQYNLGTSATACGTGVTRCLTTPTGTNAFGFPRFSADFGQVGPRVMQLAAKITF